MVCLVDQEDAGQGGFPADECAPSCADACDRFSTMADEGFDPNRSQVQDDKLAEFLTAPVSEDLTTVPGIGPGAAGKLASGEGDDKIETTHQLIGKFLAFRSPGVTCAEQCDAMWYYLQAQGIAAHRAGIVLCIAEKVNIMIPGTYDPSQFA